MKSLSACVFLSGARFFRAVCACDPEVPRVVPVAFLLAPLGSLPSPSLPFIQWEPVSYRPRHLAPCSLPAGQHVAPKSTCCKVRKPSPWQQGVDLFLPSFLNTPRGTWDFSPRPGIEAMPPAVETQILNPRSAREAQDVALQSLYPGD